MHCSATVTVALWALLATIAAAKPSTIDARTTCYSGVYMIIARGSDETQGQSRVEPIATAVESAIPNSGSNEVVYPAAAGSTFYKSVQEGAANAQQQMQDYASQCPDGKIVVMGYSQGALVLSAALAGSNDSGIDVSPLSTDVGNNVVAVVMFGDPSRVVGQGTAAAGAGACSVRSPLERMGSYKTAMNFYDSRLDDWCVAADPVCCSTGTDTNAHLNAYWYTNVTDNVVQFVQGQVSSAATVSPSASATLSQTSASAAASSTYSSSALSSVAQAVAAASSAAPSTTTTSSQTLATSSEERSTATSSSQTSTTSSAQQSVTTRLSQTMALATASPTASSATASSQASTSQVSLALSYSSAASSAGHVHQSLLFGLTSTSSICWLLFCIYHVL